MLENKSVPEAIFIAGSLSKDVGGAERVMLDTTAELARRGYRVMIWSFDEEDDSSFYRLGDGVGWQKLGTVQGGALKKLIMKTAKLFHVRKSLPVESHTVVIGFMHANFVPMVMAFSGSRLKLVASEHIVPMHYADKPMQRWIKDISFRLVDHITVVSEQVRQLHSLKLHEKISVVPNPVHAPQQRNQSNLRRLTFLSIGRFAPQKDLETLLDAFLSLAERFPDISLRIVGDGEQRSKLLQKASGSAFSDQISMPGNLQNISDEYHRALVYVHPAIYESYGLTVAEALLHGVPVIGFADCIGVNQLVINEQNGLLVNPKPTRKSSLEQAMEDLLVNEGKRKRLSENAVKFIRPTISACADKWQSILSRLAEQRVG